MKNSKSNLTAFILSGGKSSRMGTNKSLLEINGKKLIQHLAEILEQIFPEVIISSNKPELYEFVEKKIIKDIFPERGPLSGIHSALNFTNSERNFIISCDMPFISADLIKFMIKIKSNSLIVIPKSEGRIQPLCGIYSKKILSQAELLLMESQDKQTQLKGSVYELFSRVKTEIINVTKMKFYHPDLFFNINTPDDYLYAKKSLEQV